jgi:hypothetical protein
MSDILLREHITIHRHVYHVDVQIHAL